ncbi:MAG: phage tail sheath C-terminal domain-containing protein [Deltaproteobacteria bacterium]
MTAVSYPGVYIEEVPGGARPIEVASTSTCAFIGLAERGPTHARRLTSWEAFEKEYGSFEAPGYLAEGVFQFFNNGGRQAYITRVHGTNAVAANIWIENRVRTAPAAQAGPGITLTASSVGSWGNGLVVWLKDNEDDPGNRFDIAVYEQPDPEVVPSPTLLEARLPVEVIEGLSMEIGTADYFVTRIAAESDLLVAANDSGNTATTSGYVRGGLNPLLPSTPSLKLQIDVDGDGFRELTLAAAAPANLATVAADIQQGVRAWTARRNSTAANAFTAFTAAINQEGRLVLTSGSNSEASAVRVRPASADDASGLLRLGPSADPNLRAIEFGGASPRKPRVGIYEVGDASANAVRGVDDYNVSELQYEAAFRTLDRITDVSLLAVPGVPSLFDAGVTYCENRPLRDIFFIGETHMLDDEAADAEAFRKGIRKPNTYGALYFPWIESPDPTGRTDKLVPLPPSGFMAGLYARIDGTRGVWKAPAGTEASVSGAKGLHVDLTDVEQGSLNRISVNCIRRFDLAGIVSWGARTVHADPEYKYVPVRRTAIMLRRSIYDGIQWAVFEPNDHRLWAALRLNIGAFMNGLFRAGAFQGEKANDAYFVKCGLGSTMTQGDIDRGQVIAHVGFAALKPAEFVIVKIQQKAGQN